jgi:DNA-binding transcriptional ArsR family regulator
VLAARYAQIYHHEELEAPQIAEVDALLRSPEQLKALICGHLRSLWDGALAEEWRRKLPLLRGVTQALQQRQLPSASAPAVIRAVIGRDLPVELIAQLHDVEQLIFVPSPHVGLYASRFGSHTSMWIFVAVTTLTGWALRQSAIRPAEVLARIAPLADETGLKILDLLARRGEIAAQDLIQQLGLSQSSISRHLKSLGSYLIERRGEGASKRYRLSRSHLDWTIATLQRFLASDQLLLEEADLSAKGRGFAPAAGQPVGPVRGSAPVLELDADLKRFMDAQGRLTAFPTRRRDQLAVLAFLAERFELQRDYTEREVNAAIRSTLSPTFDDIATLRRELCNFQFIARERDGSRYWRLHQATPATEQRDEMA